MSRNQYDKEKDEKRHSYVTFCLTKGAKMATRITMEDGSQYDIMT